MTFAIDSFTLSVEDFDELSEPIGPNWFAWENENIVVKRFTYNLKRVWEIRGVEKDVTWDNSLIKYLQGKMAAGETVTLTINESPRYMLPSTTVYVTAIRFNIILRTPGNVRRYILTLKER
ncbi:MAG: hypothetical protein QW334_00285 [Thermofilum sp.]